METICATGAGIITNQGAYPGPEALGQAYYRQISIADDRFIPGLERIAREIHDAGVDGISIFIGRYEDRVHEIKRCVGGLMRLSRMFRNQPYVCSMNSTRSVTPFSHGISAMQFTKASRRLCVSDSVCGATL